ncbi:MAG TPA: hypothetical protein VFA41_24000 [Ktedonobacteraceae bacterium]|jgi:hypothetical protein|nr:hypothetical protein [Ktedonobacteraceae bacterium]
MAFPYEQYETLAEPLTVYYPTGQETLARWIFQMVDKASALLSELLELPTPDLEILIVDPADWSLVPREEPDEPDMLLPFLNGETDPPSLVIPTELDAIIGEPTQEKLALLLFHELAHAFLELDPRPWPEESPLWADEWQLQFAALWLCQQVLGVSGPVMNDLREQYTDIFEPEPDGKTPVTVRGFDWYEDTSAEDYLVFDLLLEQFAVDLLANYTPDILSRFLEQYRKGQTVLLSDEVTEMLAQTLGPGGTEWLEELVYF